MAIDLIHSNTIKAMADHAANLRKTGTSVAEKPAVKSAPGQTRTASADEVAFTDNAILISTASKQLESYDGVDYEKVRAVREQLENGTYNIDYELTADKMIEFESSLGGFGLF